jgi:hypothetical protein
MAGFETYRQCPANGTAITAITTGFLAHELGHILVDASLLAWKWKKSKKVWQGDSLFMSLSPSSNERM